jgi:hypothetical protein
MKAVISIALVLTAVASGCGPGPRPTVAELTATLPTAVAGEPLDFVQIVDENLDVGHPIDDVLAKLLKSREETSIVFRESRLGLGGVGAAAVDGVDGDRLLATTVETWNAPRVVRRSQQVIGDRTVWLIEESNGQQTYIYARGRIVYFAASGDAEMAKALVDALP